MSQTRFYKKTIRDVPLAGQTVLVRADYNVPLEQDGAIADDYRVVSSIPTLRYLLQQRCKVVICSHLGRPEGRADKRFTLEPVAKRLQELLEQPVAFVSECVGDQVRQAVKATGPGDVLLLENLRFHPEEEQNDPAFVDLLASDSGAAYFVQDGFGVVHRAHASTSAITQVLPGVAGLLIEKEHTVISRAMDNPERPLVAVLGGAKISDKIKVFERFIDIADTIIIGGAMANTFLEYEGMAVGKSKYEDLDDTVKHIYEKVKQKVKQGDVDEFLLLPTDVAVAESTSADVIRSTVATDAVKPNDMILDIGSESISKAARILSAAKTVVWNGTLGYAELPQFAEGSAKVAEVLAERRAEVTSIVGGGDTADFVLGWSKGDTSMFSHVSTGGGAALELMEGKLLPGIEALLDA